MNFITVLVILLVLAFLRLVWIVFHNFRQRTRLTVLCILLDGDRPLTLVDIWSEFDNRRTGILGFIELLVFMAHNWETVFEDFEMAEYTSSSEILAGGRRDSRKRYRTRQYWLTPAGKRYVHTLLKDDS